MIEPRDRPLLLVPPAACAGDADSISRIPTSTLQNENSTERSQAAEKINTKDEIEQLKPCVMQLPQPTLGIIGEIERAIKTLSRSQTAKERLCEYIITKNYVKAMIDVLQQAEDLEIIDELHALCSCMQSIRT